MTAARHSASVSGEMHDGVGCGTGRGVGCGTGRGVGCGTGAGPSTAHTRTRLPPGSPVGLPELDQKPQLAYVPLAYV